jgi:hypothetical protein
MFTFLEVNGQRVETTDPEMADWTIGLRGDTNAKRLAKLIRDRLQSLP